MIPYILPATTTNSLAPRKLQRASSCAGSAAEPRAVPGSEPSNHRLIHAQDTNLRSDPKFRLKFPISKQTQWRDTREKFPRESDRIFRNTAIRKQAPEPSFSQLRFSLNYKVLLMFFTNCLHPTTVRSLSPTFPSTIIILPAFEI